MDLNPLNLVSNIMSTIQNIGHTVAGTFTPENALKTAVGPEAAADISEAAKNAARDAKEAKSLAKQEEFQTHIRELNIAVQQMQSYGALMKSISEKV